MATFPTKLAEAFASKALEIYYANAVTEDITNQDYEGEIRDKSSILNILTFGKITSHTYTGATMTVDDLTESSGQLQTNQAVDFYFRVKSYDKFRSYIKNPEGTILDQVGKELKKVIDTFVLGFYTGAAAGNRIGVPSTVGTVAVSAAGVVTGTNTNFTSAMVGRGFTCAGLTGWYRVQSVASTTSLQLQIDIDDETSTYNGGAISAGATYTVEAVTPLQVSKSTIYDLLNQLANKLDNLEVPEDDRWCVVSPDIAVVVREAPEFIPSGNPGQADPIVRNGTLGGTLAGFKMYKSPRVNGDNVNGYHCMAGHKSAITFAMGFVENGMEDLIGNFGKAYKSLNVYGAKVVDERRKALTELFCYR